MGKGPSRSIPHHSLQSPWIPGFLDENHSYVGWDPYQHPQKQNLKVKTDSRSAIGAVAPLDKPKLGPKTDQLGKNDQSKLTRWRRANHGSDISPVLPSIRSGPSGKKVLKADSSARFRRAKQDADPSLNWLGHPLFFYGKENARFSPLVRCYNGSNPRKWRRQFCPFSTW
ncbi:hypothetical protein PAAG_12609 [Paracoccidioides lutzii Pb01]|uniref:Uncharacterized protein n=1 Tax=Paracoccidioides lutzii (strain ATCC MYA-826 / Pb01) TaxID=502779 RepID=A0A0A2UYU7_PARBA|nr:hypothetical protein PAAG_12609 [Paracoccidioides lutzii Pb01]KGQ00731.1 hypothetical protein PAAG_12609 [Paracoccidioides lutzii Pb01]